MKPSPIVNAAITTIAAKAAVGSVSHPGCGRPAVPSRMLTGP
jgi:hypothetical protein